MEDKCVFCQIVSGELPSHKVYEDDHSLAILDISPITAGHTIVLPKKHTEEMWGVEDKLYQYIMMITKRVAQRQKQVLAPFRVGTIVEGMEVPHAHIKVFPIEQGMKQVLNDQVVSEPNHEELAAMSLRLKF